MNGNQGKEIQKNVRDAKGDWIMAQRLDSIGRRNGMFLKKNADKMSKTQRKKYPNWGDFNIGIKRPSLSQYNRDHIKTGTEHSRYGKHMSTKSKLKMSKTKKRLFREGKVKHPFPKGCKRPEFSLEKHWNWKGGLSFEPYSPEFNETIREIVRNYWGRICLLCGEPENKIKLDIHHKDYNKKHSQLTNLIPLHHRCHQFTNSNREFWIEYFKDVFSN